MKKKLSIIIALIILIMSIAIYMFEEDNDIKYVFLFIGDGMSSSQVELTEIYNNIMNKGNYSDQKRLSFSKFPTIGLRKNYSNTSYITDSAASATVLASGKLTYNGSINMSMSKEKIEPITYKLHRNKKKIGIITTMSLNHATPAAFYGDAVVRTDYDDLALDLINSDFEFFAGGDFNLQKLDREDFIQQAKSKGYTIINDLNSFESIDKESKNIIINPSADSEGIMPFAIDEKTEFNLASYVETAIKVLNNENGFFIMAESGLIDYAGHNNDARGVISEVMELDEAVKVALDFAKKHPKNTLILVTGDHETGGLTLGVENTNHNLNLENLSTQKYSYINLLNYSKRIISSNITYDEMLKYLLENYGIDNIDLKEVYEKTKNGDANILKESVLAIKSKQSGINYSSSYHTGDRIPVYAYGVGNDNFSGVYNMEQFNIKLKHLLFK